MSAKAAAAGFGSADALNQGRLVHPQKEEFRVRDFPDGLETDRWQP
jgi:hypothetical protein